MRNTKMKKSTKRILKYIIEFLIVAFGVFLGVFVSEWKSQKNVNKNTEKTLTFIIDEMNSNIEQFENTIEYQTNLMEDLDSLMEGLDNKDFEEVFYKNKKFRFNHLPSYQGLRFANLENIMYESAKINGVLQELNISTTQLIARLYQKQERYVSFGEQLNSKMLNINSESKVVDVLGIFELVQYDGINMGKWLLEELKNTKEELEKAKLDKAYKQ